MSEAAITKDYDATGIFLKNKEDRLKYINREMAIMDYRSGMEGAEERGIEIGKKQEQEKMMKLLRILKEKGRENEFFEVVGNAEKLQELYREFQLEKSK